MVGAGDAFAAGYLAGLRNGAAPGTCLRLGHLMAALTIQTTADAPPLPDRQTLWQVAADEQGWPRVAVTPAALRDAELLRGKGIL